MNSFFTLLTFALLLSGVYGQDSTDSVMRRTSDFDFSQQIHLTLASGFTNHKLDFSSDTLYKVCSDESNPAMPVFPNCGYVNQQGDTIIPVGKYAACFSDIFIHFAVVMTDTSSAPVAINNNGTPLFEVLWLSGEAWPDMLNEGMIRIVDGGKIGYANTDGKIIVEPQYQCAGIFENGKARVAYNCTQERIDEEHFRPVSDEWFYIDLQGKRIE